jgi:hypothetical protein
MTELATTTSAVPDHAFDPATTIDADDVQLPRVKKAEKMSQGAAGDLGLGTLYSDTGPDDDEPVVLATAPKAFDTPSEPVRVYVVAGPIKGWSKQEDGDLQTRSYGELDEATARAEKWDKTYKYFLCLPDAEDNTLPFTILFKRTSTPAARDINTILSKAAQHGPTHEVPFDLTTVKKKGNGFEWSVFKVRRADVEAKNLAAELEAVNAVLGIAQAKASQPVAVRPSAVEPDEQPAL